ncbi:MAG TPA: hypothetical protein VFU00_08540 [Gemmatimonadales bacterium]|nr:hypothetical protein [Gemmatimonadales bacterium]
MAFLLTACGGASGGPSAPTPLYPAVAGNYSLSGTFDDFPESFSRVTGTFSIQQASTATGTLTGTSRLTWWVDGESALYDFPLSSASVTTTGTLTFTFVDDVGDSWTFTGQVASGTVTGRHSLNIGEAGGDLTGDFTATRTGGATVTRAEPPRPPVAPPV